MKCPACGGQSDHFITSKYYSYVRCSACGLVFVEQMPSDAAIVELYGKNYYIFGQEEVQRRRAQLHASIVQEFGVRKGNCLM